MTEVSIPPSVSCLGRDIFDACRNLERLVFQGVLPLMWDAKPFEMKADCKAYVKESLTGLPPGSVWYGLPLVFMPDDE